MTGTVDMRVRIGEPRASQPGDDRLGHVRLGARVRGLHRPHRGSAPWSPRACRSSRGRATTAPASPRRASGMLNSIGLQNPGVEAFCANDLAWLATQNVPVIVNVVGHSVAEYVAVTERLDAEPDVAGFELNISCPNVDAGGMAFGTSCPAAAEVVSAVRAATTKPLIVKLCPNVTDIVRDRACGRGRRCGCRVPHQHAARHGDRHTTPSGRSSPEAWAASRGPRSSRWRCAWCGRSRVRWPCR